MSEVSLILNAGENVRQTAQNYANMREGDLVKNLFTHLARKSLELDAINERKRTKKSDFDGSIITKPLQPNVVVVTPFGSLQPGCVSFVLQSWVDLASAGRTQVQDELITRHNSGDIVQFTGDRGEVLLEDYARGVYGGMTTMLAMAYQLDVQAAH